ncbi:hypothetical protein KKA14_15000, partial [bacterium]|nr:hypothetical protein [bacterium]
MKPSIENTKNRIYKVVLFCLLLIPVLSLQLSYAQDVIQLGMPEIIDGTVLNNSFFYGEISIGTTNEGTPIISGDKEAYYSLDGGTTWNPAEYNTSKQTIITSSDSRLDSLNYNSFVAFDDGSWIVNYSENLKWKYSYDQCMSCDVVTFAWPWVFSCSGPAVDKCWIATQSSECKIVHSMNFLWPFVEDCVNNFNYLINNRFNKIDDLGNFVKEGVLADQEKMFKIADNQFLGTIIINNQIKLYLYNSEKELQRELSIPNNDISQVKSNPNIKALTNGGFAVIWESANQDGSQRGIFGRVYGSDLEPIGYEFQVNEQFLGNQYSPVLTSLSDGSFVTAWINEDVNDGNLDIYARKYDEDGNALTSEYRVNAYTSYDQKAPKIVDLSDGGYVVVWTSNTQDGQERGIYSRVYDNTNATTGEDVLVNTTITVGDQHSPEVFKNEGNSFSVSWADEFTKKYYLTRISGDTKSESTLSQFENSFPVEFKSIPGYGYAGIRQLDKKFSVDIIPIRPIIRKGLTPTTDINIQFKLVDAATSEEWLSPIRSYKYGNPAEGQGGTISYLDGYTNDTTTKVTATVPDGVYSSLQLYQKRADLSSDTCSDFEEWQASGSQTTLTREVDVDLEDGRCYQFKWIITNSTDVTHDYFSDNVIKSDRTPPLIEVTQQNQNYNSLSLDVSITDTAGLVATSSSSFNSDPDSSITGSALSYTLDNGSNHITLKAEDAAGNLREKHLFVTAELSPPEIHIYGLKEGDSYSDSLVISYIFTQELTDLLIYVDGEPITDLEITVNGDVRSNLDNLQEGSEVIVKGKNQAGEDVITVLKVVNGELVVDISSLSDGAHSLTIQGYDSLGNFVKKTTGFNVDKSALAFSVISPQQRVYETGDIEIKHWSSATLTRVWYRLNGGEEKEDLFLSQLPNGSYQIVISATSEGGKTASVSVDFEVQNTIPELVVLTPVPGTTYQSNNIPLNYSSNGAVSYQVDDQSGNVSSGQTIQLSGDGEHTLMITATHPVSGKKTQQSIVFSTDSL